MMSYDLGETQIKIILICFMNFETKISHFYHRFDFLSYATSLLIVLHQKYYAIMYKIFYNFRCLLFEDKKKPKTKVDNCFYRYFFLIPFFSFPAT